MKTCSKCGISKPIEEFHKNKRNIDGLACHCKKCRIKSCREQYEKYGREKYGHISMYENKSCPQYLGVVIGERLCRHLFKDVEVMPPGNVGYDIVCNKGKKIDVKTGCITLINGKYPHWGFSIGENTIADFFIFVAFDNRTDLNPLHLWMIPGKEVNEKTSKSISISRISKWDEWKLDINDAQICCAKIKVV